MATTEVKKVIKPLEVSKEASVDFPVKVKSLKADPYHKDGAVFEMGSKKAKELVERGWVEYANKKDKDDEK